MKIKQRWVQYSIRQPAFKAKKLETKRTTKKQENLKNCKFLNLFLNRVNPVRNKYTLVSKELDAVFYNLSEQLEFKR